MCIRDSHITDESKKKAKENMRTSENRNGNMRPACLPEKSYKSERGVFAGWLDQEPFYRLSTTDLEAYEKEYLTIKRVEVKFFRHTSI